MVGVILWKINSGSSVEHAYLSTHTLHTSPCSLVREVISNKAVNTLFIAHGKITSPSHHFGHLINKVALQLQCTGSTLLLFKYEILPH